MADAEKKMCAICDKEITIGRYLTASGKTYHADCFKCKKCDKVIAGTSYMTDDHKHTYCIDCYYDKYAPTCAKCDSKIRPKEGEKSSEWVTAGAREYHTDCYKCEDCGLSLDSKKEGHECCPVNDHLYCRPCSGKHV